MQDLDSSNLAFTHVDVGVPDVPARPAEEVVATHVLVPAEQVEKLRLLAKRSRIAQSEYLREAVDDLLRKYTAEVG